MKIDIEGSENFIVESGAQMFDYLDIPIILMEWAVLRMTKPRASMVLNFFIKHNYTATHDICHEIKIADAFKSWPWDIYWIQKNRLEIC
jgi:hypothetical protein